MWNSELYDGFKKERIQPSIDLVNRMEGVQFNKILDVGCGSGMSTITLKNKFKDTNITGVDLSGDMINKAIETIKGVTFFKRDCSKELDDLGKFDLVFSNAFLQWLKNQEEFIKNSKALLNEGGILAIQVPSFEEMEIAVIIKNTAKEFDASNKLFCDIEDKGCFNYNLNQYYDMFSRYYSKIDIWQTNYIHQMKSCDDIVNMLKGTALIPYLECLNEKEKVEFLDLLTKNTAKHYKKSENGVVLFEFKRIFIIAREQI